MVTQLYRLVWLYSAVHGFAVVRSPAGQVRAWPESWRLALGRIAMSTPPLAPAGPPEAVLARLEAELGERLLHLGPAGTAPALAGVQQRSSSRQSKTHVKRLKSHIAMTHAETLPLTPYDMLRTSRRAAHGVQPHVKLSRELLP